VECVRLLLDRGAGVDAADVSSWLAIRMHREALVCEVCGKLGWVFVCAGLQSDGRTPLSRASEGGHLECVRLLLDRGAGVDTADVSSLLVTRTHRVAWASRSVQYSTCG
jgi:hypothetical protein